MVSNHSTHITTRSLFFTVLFSQPKYARLSNSVRDHGKLVRDVCCRMHVKGNTTDGY